MCYGFTTTDMGQLELHVFSEAPQCAYGAVVYIRYILNKSMTSNFVLGKSILAPNKADSSMSILKLELLASDNAVRLKLQLWKKSIKK